VGRAVRFVVFGAGAIGGAIGAGLHRAGADVTLIARGAHGEAIAHEGLTLHTPRERRVLRIPVVGDPAGVHWREDHVVLLTTKSQDTAGALAGLASAAPPTVAVVCAQNGIENERLALRLFPRVYGAVVVVPAAHLDPGVVCAYGLQPAGVIDVGRYVRGVDERAAEIASALRAAGFDSEARADVMRHKHAKLISNLANAVDAICGPEAAGAQLVGLARAEGRAVLSAAGLELVAEELDAVRARSRRLEWGLIAGESWPGSSTMQSLARGAGTVESDYLNGEIVLRGRLAGVPTPVNALLQALVNEMARERRRPGWMTPEQVLARLEPGPTRLNAGP
jgi:2-dehydropantoate 2-reductase